jgi:hypothetical protein
MAAHNSIISLHLTFKVYDVFATQISETEGFAGLQKCGGAKLHIGACADWGFAESEPPEQGGEHIPFVM